MSEKNTVTVLQALYGSPSAEVLAIHNLSHVTSLTSFLCSRFFLLRPDRNLPTTAY